MFSIQIWISFRLSLYVLFSQSEENIQNLQEPTILCSDEINRGEIRLAFGHNIHASLFLFSRIQRGNATMLNNIVLDPIAKFIKM